MVEETVVDVDGQDSKEQTLPVLFRNYKPYDTKLKKYIVQPDDSVNQPKVLSDDMGKPIEMDVIMRELTNLKSEEINIVPKKNNYDLKSQVEKRLLKLKKRTQKVIIEILREKLSIDKNDSSEED